MLIKYEVTLDIDESRYLSLDGIKNSISMHLEDYKGINAIYSTNIEKVEKPFSKDLMDFANGKLIIYVKNEEEYMAFIQYLQNSGYQIGNPAEYPGDQAYFHPNYNYFYIQSPPDRYMNALHFMNTGDANMFCDIYNKRFINFSDIDKKLPKEDNTFSLDEIDII